MFNDAYGRKWSVIEKAPVLSSGLLDESTQYPVEGFIAGTIIRQYVIRDREVATIDLRHPWNMSTEDGQEVLDVFIEQTFHHG